MIALLQRVTQGSVTIAGNERAAIQRGVVLLLGIEKTDTQAHAERLAERVSHYRIFSDAEDKMNLSLLDTGFAALVISQFTLAADTAKGRRPSFSSAAPPEQAEPLYRSFVAALEQSGVPVSTGVFGADMAVALVNDGPVTFSLTV